MGPETVTLKEVGSFAVSFRSWAGAADRSIGGASAAPARSSVRRFTVLPPATRPGTVSPLKSVAVFALPLQKEPRPARRCGT